MLYEQAVGTPEELMYIGLLEEPILVTLSILFAIAVYIPPLVTGFELPDVGVLSNVRASYFPPIASLTPLIALNTPPDVTGLELPLVGAESKVSAFCLAARPFGSAG